MVTTVYLLLTLVSNDRQLNLLLLYTLYSISAPFTLTTVYLLLMLVGNDRQLNLPHGNLKLPSWPCKSEKEAITREKKTFSEICQLETLGVRRRLRW